MDVGKGLEMWEKFGKSGNRRNWLFRWLSLRAIDV